MDLRREKPSQRVSDLTADELAKWLHNEQAREMQNSPEGILYQQQMQAAERKAWQAREHGQRDGLARRRQLTDQELAVLRMLTEMR
jgi:hypothetical protein